MFQASKTIFHPEYECCKSLYVYVNLLPSSTTVLFQDDSDRSKCILIQRSANERSRAIMPCKSSMIKRKVRAGWWDVVLGRTMADKSRDLSDLLPRSSSINYVRKKKRRFCHRQQPSVLLFFLNKRGGTVLVVRRAFTASLLSRL